MFARIREFGRERKAAAAFAASPASRRDLVFYSESASYGDYLLPFVDRLISDHGQPVSYLTSDPRDPVLGRDDPLLDAYMIGDGVVRTWLFRSIQCRVMVMTMPDLDSFHLKRSLYPVQYVFVPHNMNSMHMVFRKGAHDAFDRVFCVGEYHVRELRRAEELYDIPARQLDRVGYPKLDRTVGKDDDGQVGDPPVVLIAPTWVDGNLMEVCGGELVESLLAAGLRVILRPHRDSIDADPPWLAAVRTRFAGDSRFGISDGRTGGNPVDRADLLVTDWSGAALSFSLGREKPVLSVDVPAKVLNADFERFELPAFEETVRHRIGRVLPPDRAADAGNIARQLISERQNYVPVLRELRRETVFNPGGSAAVGAAILHRLATARD